MLLVAGLAPLVVLATSVVANPSVARDHLITVPISKHINSNGASDFIKRDRKHLRNLVRRGHRWRSLAVNKSPDTPLNNTGGMYVATIGIGEPVTKYQLLVDTGSATTWVGANTGHAYVQTKSSVKTHNSANITYNNGFFSGLVYNDTVTISDDVTISQQSIGVASNSSGFSPLDGILGIGPNDLTFGVFSPDSNIIAQTVTDNLFLQGKIQKNQVAVSFEPTNSIPTVNGELTFGGADSSKYIGDMYFFPPAKSAQVNTFWSADAAFRYDDTTILHAASGIFDTGTTLTGLATDAYKRYVKETGAVFDETTGLLRIDSNRYKKLKSLYFNIGGQTYELNRNAQIWPRALNTLIGGKKDFVYLIVNDLGPDLSKNIGFIAGMTFLERFYVVFDSGTYRVGLAKTQFTDSMNTN